MVRIDSDSDDPVRHGNNRLDLFNERMRYTVGRGGCHVFRIDTHCNIGIMIGRSE